ncbi:MAG: hypothetical protein M3Q75_11480, partial [Gemmatimonadota bacterium]|nr:hypothetical protein [Gemmatimonadota bacterium]
GHSSTSVQLRGWLEDQSGVARLEQILRLEAVRQGECARVDGALTALSGTAAAQGWDTQARRLIEAARFQPGFHALEEWQALEMLVREDPGHELVAVLQGLIGGAGKDSVVGGPPCARQSLLDLAASYQARQATARTGAEARAVRVIARSLWLKATELEP